MSEEVRSLFTVGAGIFVGAVVGIGLCVRPPVQANGRFSITTALGTIALVAFALLTFRQRTMFWWSGVMMGAWSMFLFAGVAAVTLDDRRRAFAAGFSLVGLGFLIPALFAGNWVEWTFHRVPDAVRILLGEMLDQTNAEAFRRLVYVWLAIAMAFVGGLAGLFCFRLRCKPANPP
jgi:hypothetical protein